MKVGDLVKMKAGYSQPGFVIRVQEEYYGASQAYKISHVERGKCIRPDMVDIIAPTRDGIRDRVLVHWPDAGWEYVESTKLVVVSES